MLEAIRDYINTYHYDKKVIQGENIEDLIYCYNNWIVVDFKTISSLIDNGHCEYMLLNEIIEKIEGKA